MLVIISFFCYFYHVMLGSVQTMIARYLSVRPSVCQLLVLHWYGFTYSQTFFTVG